ncbi:MAG: hypothetical protein LBC68_05230 [Prevotellaceae bacterium]|jgi:hypothetical protein|nr:hypothetical protein [Prevotellaceae bacterium]
MTKCYKKERDEDFLAACERIRNQNRGQYLSCTEIAIRAAAAPAGSFYLDERTIFHIISRMRSNSLRPPRQAHIRQLYTDIWARYVFIKTVHNRQYVPLTTIAIAGIIETQPAPRFYFSRAHAKELYYRCLRNKI